jgi:hypothetical protein
VAEGGGSLNLIATYPPVPFGLTVYESVDVFRSTIPLFPA